MTSTRSHWRAAGALATCVGIATAHAAAGAQARPDSAPVVSDSVGTRDGEGRAEDGGRTLGLSLMPGALGVVGNHLYTLVADESDDIRPAIDRSVAHMNFIIRPIARRRLTKANRPAEHLEFDVQPDTLAVTFDAMNPIMTPLNGDSTPWMRGGTHERYEVHVELGGDTVRQVIKTDDGQRENVFVFLDDGAKVLLHVILTAERLPTPLRYTLVYRREY
jgi:hypothetical protein